MSYYRLYFMDPFHGHIERFEEFDAGDDGEAISLALPKQGFLALELWCSHRKIARFEPVDLSSQLLEKRRELKAVKARLAPTSSEDESESRSG